jgi:hypothetical protein
MSEKRGAELFRALHAIIDAVTNLNLRDLEAEAKASSSLSAEEAHLPKHLQRAKLRILIPIGLKFRTILFLFFHCLLDLVSHRLQDHPQNFPSFRLVASL